MHHRRLALTASALISWILLTILTSSAQAYHNEQYTSPPPEPPSKPQYTNPWYIIDSESGIKYFASLPITPQRTLDGNLFVSSVILTYLQDGAMSASYSQVNCGALSYRNLTPWFVKARDGSESSFLPESYGWQYFTSGSALEVVGKSLCEKAAGDLGIFWNWN
jgi:hypothetical protein